MGMTSAFAPWAGTAHGVLQAVNTYEHHEGVVRGATRAERDMLRAVSGDFGQTDRESWQQLSQVLQTAGGTHRAGGLASRLAGETPGSVDILG